MKSSIYLHIPYCKQARSIGFPLSTNLKTREEVLGRMLQEIETRGIVAPWNNTQIGSIYFGEVLRAAGKRRD